jgi:phosphatidylserine/phosphatidylglycerophosphate/cardiolipin synthase-like enzyme
MIHVVLEGGRDATSSVDQDNRETAQRLRRAGIDVSFDSPRRTNHTKAVVIDRTYTFLGSHNLTNSALKYNHELSLFVHSPELSREILHYITMLRASAETR